MKRHLETTSKIYSVANENKNLKKTLCEKTQELEAVMSEKSSLPDFSYITA